ncbi:MAG TPA: hypothetical protein VN931_09050, partial [Fibrobacteria bacterium]|nr:hypothetical protein [Fibrobacteria bacterium]
QWRDPEDDCCSVRSDPIPSGFRALLGKLEVPGQVAPRSLLRGAFSIPSVSLWKRGAVFFVRLELREHFYRPMPESGGVLVAKILDKVVRC